MNTTKIVTKDITQLKVSVDHYENRDYEWDGRFTFDVLTTPIEVKAKEATIMAIPRIWIELLVLIILAIVGFYFFIFEIHCLIF